MNRQSPPATSWVRPLLVTPPHHPINSSVRPPGITKTPRPTAHSTVPTQHPPSITRSHPPNPLNPVPKCPSPISSATRTIRTYILPHYTTQLPNAASSATDHSTRNPS